MNTIEVIFPKVRAEIIRLLFAQPGKEYHLRELSRLSHLAIGTIQKEVRKLSHIELLVSRRDGNRLYYRANTAHPICPDLQGIALKTTGLRDQFVPALAELPGIEFAFVFGSPAAGVAGATSDIDLLVVGDLGLRSLAPKLRPISSALGREINPHVLTRETLRRKVHTGDAFIVNVLDASKIWITGSRDEFGKLV